MQDITFIFIAITTLKSIMVVNKCDCIFALTHTEQTSTFTAAITTLCHIIIKYSVFSSKVKGHRVLISIFNTTPQRISIAIPIFHHCQICLAGTVIVIDMRIVEALAVIITETIILHHIRHPFRISAEHLTHLFIFVIPITCRSIVSFTSITIIFTTSSFTLATTRFRIAIHFIRIANPTCIWIEHTILSKILHIVVTPTRLVARMVHHHIGYHLCATSM